MISTTSLQHPVLILPGFGNSYKDYQSPLNQGEEYGFIKALTNRGINTYVVPIERYDWLQIGKGLFDPSYYSYSCLPNKLLKFYFDKTHTAICNIIKETGQKPILIGHSAGGWLARGMMGDGIWQGGDRDSSIYSSSTADTYNKQPRDADPSTNSNNILLTKDMITGLVTLGTPHYPPIIQKYDNTRGAIQHVHTNYPGAYLLQKYNIFYISIASKAILSDQKADFRSIESFAYTSYKQLLGREEDVDGQPGILITYTYYILYIMLCIYTIYLLHVILYTIYENFCVYTQHIHLYLLHTILYMIYNYICYALLSVVYVSYTCCTYIYVYR